MFTFPNKVIAISQRHICPRPLEEQVYRIAENGISRLILREKDLAEEEYLRLAERVLSSCERCGVELTIHNFPNAARELGIDRLHMPLPMLTAELCAEFETVGSSVHSAVQLEQAERLGAKYVTAGHIFVTNCKKGLPPRGLDFLRDMCERANVPVYAIGGINADNAEMALNAGADGVCVMSAIMQM